MTPDEREPLTPLLELARQGDGAARERIAETDLIASR